MRNRELDCEIAEKLFGWKHSLCANFVGQMQTPESVEEGSLYVNIIPYYSSDITQAWLVIEEMMKKHFPFELGDSNGDYYAMFWGELDSPVYGKSMPDCICKAALKALEGRTRM
jgi:hypothetical protein